MKIFPAIFAVTVLVLIQKSSSGPIGRLIGLGALGGFLAGHHRGRYYPGGYTPYRHYPPLHAHGYGQHFHPYPPHYGPMYSGYNYDGYHVRGKRHVATYVTHATGVYGPHWPYYEIKPAFKTMPVGEQDDSQVQNISPVAIALERILRLDAEKCVLKLVCEVEKSRNKDGIYNELSIVFGNLILETDSENDSTKVLFGAIIAGKDNENPNECSKKYKTCDVNLETMMDVLFPPPPIVTKHKIPGTVPTPSSEPTSAV